MHALALIRGINVGATRALPMQLLRDCCESTGLENPQTYIQSGNVVFSTPAAALKGVARRLEDAIESCRPFRPSVIIRTHAELAAAIAANPFPARAAAEPSKLLIMFLQSAPPATTTAALAQLKRTDEQLHLHGRELYIDFPHGAGKSKLNMAALEKALTVPATARNWNTVNKLLAIMEARTA